MPVPAKDLHEHSDLIWNDGVVAETYLDFDAPQISTTEAVGWLAGAVGGLFGLYWLVGQVLDPEGNRPFAKRELPFDNLRVELGGPPDLEKEEYTDAARRFQVEAKH